MTQTKQFSDLTVYIPEVINSEINTLSTEVAKRKEILFSPFMARKSGKYSVFFWALIFLGIGIVAFNFVAITAFFEGIVAMFVWAGVAGLLTYFTFFPAGREKIKGVIRWLSEIIARERIDRAPESVKNLVMDTHAKNMRIAALKEALADQTLNSAKKDIQNILNARKERYKLLDTLNAKLASEPNPREQNRIQESINTELLLDELAEEQKNGIEAYITEITTKVEDIKDAKTTANNQMIVWDKRVEGQLADLTRRKNLNQFAAAVDVLFTGGDAEFMKNELQKSLSDKIIESQIAFDVTHTKIVDAANRSNVEQDKMRESARLRYTQKS